MRGTCLSFAVTAVHEHARFSASTPTQDEFSTEFLFWHAKQLDGQMSVDGTTVMAIGEALAAQGQCAEALWPYDDRVDLARQYGPPPRRALLGKRYRGTLEAFNHDLGSIQTKLEGGRSVVACIELWDGFYRCTTSDLVGPSSDLDGALHAVCVVGFDRSRRAVKLRNSWGSKWGNGGYAWLDETALSVVLRRVSEVNLNTDDTTAGRGVSD